MIRLRFVQEYRGRRIVTNGKLYGIQGALITDCRYLDVQGARTAIDSEAAIEARRKYFEWRERVSPHVEYFSDYKSRAFTCECGWSGGYEKLARETFGVVKLSCPACARMVLYVTLPSDEDIERAAAEGNKEARAMMPRVRERKRREEQWSRQALKGLSQLPAVMGDALAFVWDLEESGGKSYYVIMAGAQEVWRERARAEDWERFNEVKRLFKKKYRGRFASLTPSAAAMANLLRGNTMAKLVPT